MGNTKETNIKNCNYYFDDMINIKDFDPNLLKIDKMSFNGINIYYTGYITIKRFCDCENTNSVNPLDLLVNHASGHIECNSVECNSIEEKNGYKYLVFDENKEVLKKYLTLG